MAYVRAVHLPQQAQASLGGQRGSDARAALLTGLPAGGAEPLLEPVDEAGHAVERGHGGDAQRGRHQLSRPTVPMGAMLPRRARLLSMEEHGVVASAFRIVEIAEAATLLAAGDATWSDGELRYARDKSDPERRLAARLAAKRAALELLGAGLGLADVEVVRGLGGPPALRFSTRARERLGALGADRALVSLTHGRAQAAAAVLLIRDAAC